MCTHMMHDVEVRELLARAQETYYIMRGDAPKGAQEHLA